MPVSRFPRSIRHGTYCSSRLQPPRLPNSLPDAADAAAPQTQPDNPAPLPCQGSGTSPHAPRCSSRGCFPAGSAKFIPRAMISVGQDCLGVRISHAGICKECRQGYVFTGTTRSCGREVKTALSKLTLIKRTQYFLLITSHALNIGQAGWVSQCKINQSYMKNPRATFQLTKFSL